MMSGASGVVPSWPLGLKLCSDLNVHLPLPSGIISNTVPDSCAPPSAVVPYKLPAESKVSGAEGTPPVVPLNLCSTLNFHFPPDGIRVKILPLPDAPREVVPYRLPAVSKITPPSGVAPSDPLVKS